MKKNLLLLIMLICTRFIALAQFSGSGEGTEESPYLIFNVTQLSQMANFGGQSGVVFRLMKDLDVSDWIDETNPHQGWTPVGANVTPFKGKLLGENHTISGLRINRTSENYVGFFGSLNGATITDLNIEGSDVTGSSYVGGFAGSVSNSMLTNCHIKLNGTLSSSSGSYIGGFCGAITSSTVSNFNVEAIVSSSGASYVGGFSGVASNGVIFSDGSIIANVTSSMPYTGGFTGSSSTVAISEVKIIGKIIGTTHVGGFVGKSDGTDNLTNLSYTGDLFGKDYIGGISAFLSAGSKSTFTSCFSKGKIIATGDYVGGIVGVSQGGGIGGMERCSHFGDIEGESYAGGLIGGMVRSDENNPILHTYVVRYSTTRQSNPTTSNTYWEEAYYENIIKGISTTVSINNCAVIGNIAGKDYIGGLIGYDAGSISYSATTKTATFTYPKFVSYANPVKYFYLFKDDIYANKYSYASDLWEASLTFNYNEYKENEISLSLTNSYFNGCLNGVNNVGGLFGYKSGGLIESSYSCGTIQGNQNVGGIIGTILKSGYVGTTQMQSNVSNNYVINGAKNVGRIYGVADNSRVLIGPLGSTQGNRALATTRVIENGMIQEINDDLKNGTSVGISLLKLKATYEALGWNFNDDWNQLEESSFPYKKYQAAPPIITSDLVAQATAITGTSADGGTVYLSYKDNEPVSTICVGNDWSVETEPLQSGTQVRLYAEVNGLVPSYFTTATVSYLGKGTEASPYLVYAADDLQGISKSGYYKIMNDIDLTSWINDNSPLEGWKPVGQDGMNNIYFDGDGHRITGLWINSDKNYNGLFSTITNGHIKNLLVEVASEKVIKGGDFSSILAGRIFNSTIENCTLAGNVEGTTHIGGLAGFIENTGIDGIKYIGNLVTTSDNAYIGGLVGQASDTNINNSIVQASISGTMYVGGVAGYASNGDLTSLLYSGTLDSNSDGAFVGGILGKAENCQLSKSRTMSDIKSTGNTSYVGGAIGFADRGSVNMCVANDNITTLGKSSYLGGLVGYSNIEVVRSCSNGSVTSTGDESLSGGLIGYSNGNVSNCYSTANVNGTKYTAGLVAYSTSIIDMCYAKGNITGLRYGAGIVANMDGASAVTSNCVAINGSISLSTQASWGCRVIASFGNGCTDPEENNYAISTMQVSLNGVQTKIEDDIMQGITTHPVELMQSATFASMGWNMTQSWNIEEGKTYPYFADIISQESIDLIIFDNSSLQVIEGKSAMIKTTILPVYASYKALNWSSDNPQVVTVENGIVSAIAVGTAAITATAMDGSNISETCTVTVLPNLETEIAALQELINQAQILYDNSTEGNMIGQYSVGSRAVLLSAIQVVSSLISEIMTVETLTECMTIINEAIRAFDSQKIRELITTIEADKEQTTGSVILIWKANDDSIEYYNVYYSENDQPFVLWLPNTTKETATFKGQPGATYRFTVTARDKAGNREQYNESKNVEVEFKAN